MDAFAMHKSLATTPLRKTKVDGLRAILCLPDKKRIIVHSYHDGSLRVMNLETGTQIGKEWEEKDGVSIMVSSPDGKKVASWSWDGTVKLWSVDTGKVIKTWKWDTTLVNSMGWSPDGGRMVSGSSDGTLRVWDVDSGKTILGPINIGDDVEAVCYSPDAKMIATSLRSDGLKIWNANSGELLKTFKGRFSCLAWTSDLKMLVRVADTALDVSENTVQLWDLETDQPIGTPLHHQKPVDSVTFSVDGKFLLTCCRDKHIYTWDVSAIVERAGLLPDIVDITPRPAKIKGARIPPGFFDDALRDANSRIRLSQSHAPPTPTPHQRTFSPFTSVWRSSEPHGATESATLSPSRPFRWTRNLSSILRRRDRSDVQLGEVEVPCTAGKPRNYHARKRKMPTASSSQPSNTHTTQTHSAAIQSTPSSPPAVNTSPVSAVAGTPGTMGAPSRPHNSVAVWRARFVRCLCCAPI